MYRYRWIFCSVLCFKTFASSAFGNINEMHGKLLVTPGHSIVQINLATGEKTILAEMIRGVESISAIDNKRFLVGSQLGENSEIFEFNIISRLLTPVIKGYDPLFIKKQDKFVFAFGAQFVTTLDHPERNVQKVISTAPIVRYPIKLNDEAVLYKQIDGDRERLYKFNVTANRLEPFAVDASCTAHLWRSATNEMLCSGWPAPKDFYLSTLVGGTKKQVDFSDFKKSNITPVYYIADLDALVLTVPQVRGSSEHLDLWLYSFSSRSARKIGEDLGSKPGSVTWVPEWYWR